MMKSEQLDKLNVKKKKSIFKNVGGDKHQRDMLRNAVPYGPFKSLAYKEGEVKGEP
jgi:hypothetical protein